MANLDLNVQVDVTLDGASVGKKGFGVPMFLTKRGYADTHYSVKGVTLQASPTKDAFVIDGDKSWFKSFKKIKIVGSDHNDGEYTVYSVTSNGLDTTVTVLEKIPSSADDLGNMYLANGDWLINSATAATKTFVLSGDFHLWFDAVGKFFVYGSTDNDGTYTVVSSSYDGDVTSIIVKETVPANSAADGNIALGFNGNRYALCSQPADVDAFDYILSADDIANIKIGLSQTLRPKQICLGFWGINETVYEALTALKLEYDGWYGFVINSREATDILAAAAPDSSSASAWVEADGGKLFIAQMSEAKLKSQILDANASYGDDDVASALHNLSLSRTMIHYHATDTEVVDWALLCNRSAIDPDVADSIWSYVTLVGVTPIAYTATEITNMDSKSANYYTTLRGVGSTGMGVVAKGTKIDLVIIKDWLEARGGEAVAQCLLDTVNAGSKIPYEDKGFSVFQNVLSSVFDQGVQAGHFVSGSTSVIVPAYDDISAADKAARILRITGGAIPSGAVEKIYAQFNVSLSFTA